MSLPARPKDGQIGIIKIGTGVDTTYIRLRWNATRERWVGPEIAAVRGTDQIGATCQFEPFTTKQYTPLNNSPTYTNDLSTPIEVGETFKAGLNLEYRQSFEAEGNGGKAIFVGYYFYETNSGNYNTPSGKHNGEDAYTIPPTGGWAETSFVKSSSTASGVRKWNHQGWTTLPGVGGAGIGTCTKESLYAAAYAYMDTGATGSGKVYDSTLWIRWVL